MTFQWSTLSILLTLLRQKDVCYRNLMVMKKILTRRQQHGVNLFTVSATYSGNAFWKEAKDLKCFIRSCGTPHQSASLILLFLWSFYLSRCFSTSFTINDKAKDWWFLLYFFSLINIISVLNSITRQYQIQQIGENKSFSSGVQKIRRETKIYVTAEKCILKIKCYFHIILYFI